MTRKRGRDRGWYYACIRVCEIESQTLIARTRITCTGREATSQAGWRKGVERERERVREGSRNRNAREGRVCVCVGTCSQHQWSVSASEAPKRRGATLGARHNAASTHPLWLFLSIPLSHCLSLFRRLPQSLPLVSLSIEILLLSSSLPTACLPSLRRVLHRRARNLRKSSRRRPPAALLNSCQRASFSWEEVSSRIFLATHNAVVAKFPLLFLSFHGDTRQARSILLLPHDFRER